MVVGHIAASAAQRVQQHLTISMIPPLPGLDHKPTDGVIEQWTDHAPEAFRSHRGVAADAVEDQGAHLTTGCQRIDNLPPPTIALKRIGDRTRAGARSFLACRSQTIY